MTGYVEYHDSGEKQVLGTTIPAGLSPEEELDVVLDLLFEHPNVGPFISHLLIQRFVTSNPSAAYIERVADVFNDNGEGVRGDLLAVVEAILMDEEARAERTADEGFGKLKEPLLKQTHLWRAFDIGAQTYTFHLPERELLQGPLRSPSVFNFYYPDFSPAGEIRNSGQVAPEFQIVTDSSMTSMMNRSYITATGGHWNTYVELDVGVPLLLVDDPEKLVAYLDLILLAGTMTEELRASLLAYWVEHEDAENESKVRELIYLITASAEFAVQQ